MSNGTVCIMRYAGTWYSLKNSENLTLICHWRHSLGCDVSDHFFWSEYWVNQTRFHSLSSEFSLYMELESSEIHSSTNEISSLHR